MVNKILNQNTDGITVRELLGLSPDLVKELWGIKRLPVLKGAVQVPATHRDLDMATEEGDIRFSNFMDTEKHLYACTSPPVLGKIEGKYKVKMLIDSDSEMCVMGLRIWKKLEVDLLIGRDVLWSIGSTNAKRHRYTGSAITYP